MPLSPRHVEVLFSRQEVVGGEDVDLIIETFVKKEEQNFALFNYVNELNADVEKLQDEIKTMHEDIAKTKTEEETQDSGRSTLIKHLEVALRNTYF